MYVVCSIFLLSRWLADDEDDGAIVREAFVDSEAALLRSKKQSSSFPRTEDSSMFNFLTTYNIVSSLNIHAAVLC